MMKVIVFDLGGTLMEFRGMTSNWNEYYITAFRKVNQTLDLKLSEHELEESAKILRSYNPRITKRENEIMPEIIFSDAISNWANKPNINEVIKIFFEEVIQNAHIYDYSIRLLKKCKEAGYKIACLTDLPNGMSDKIFKTAIPEIIGCLDLYVSSQSCGVRKPNKGGYVKSQEYLMSVNQKYCL